MTPDLVLFLSWGGICAVLSASVTALVFLHREERAERARQAAVDVEFAPVLSRVRPAVTAVRQHRMRALARLRAVGARLAAWARAAVTRQHAERFAAALRRITAQYRQQARPTPAEPVAAPPGYFAGLDSNSRGWPINPPPAAPPPAPPVGRVPVALDVDPMRDDFAAWLRGENARLRHAARLRQADPDATGVLPRVVVPEMDGAR